MLPYSAPRQQKFFQCQRACRSTPPSHTYSRVLHTRQHLPLSRCRSAERSLRNPAASAQQSSDGFFNRDFESQCLVDLLKSKPDSVTVIVGPPDCGKTTLLKRIAAQHWLLADGVPTESVPGWLDGRRAELTSPQSMANALAAMTQENGILYRAIVSSVPRVPGVNLGAAVLLLRQPEQVSGMKRMVRKAGTLVLSFISRVSGATFGPVGVQLEGKKVSDIERAVKSADTLFKEYNKVKTPTAPWPLLVIDEANHMEGWSSTAERDDILDFLVNVTKVERSAHVILATSDYSFLTWIRERIGNRSEALVLGDFPEEEAKDFFVNTVLPPDLRSSVTEEVWKGIYQVCGGNAGLLMRAGSRFGRTKDWTKSLKSVVQPILMDMTWALRGKDLADGVRYESQQFELVASLLLDAPAPHAVPWDDLAAAIGGMDSSDPPRREAVKRGEPPLLAMVKANVLAYRPKSDLSRDLPPGSFKRWPVGTALTAGHLHAMRILRDEGML